MGLGSLGSLKRAAPLSVSVRVRVPGFRPYQERPWATDNLPRLQSPQLPQGLGPAWRAQCVNLLITGGHGADFTTALSFPGRTQRAALTGGFHARLIMSQANDQADGCLLIRADQADGCLLIYLEGLLSISGQTGHMLYWVELSPQNSHPPRTLACDIIWKWGLCKCS